MKIRPLIGRRIGIGRRLHVNQPLISLYNWASNNAVASLLYADMFELYLVIKFYIFHIM